MMIPYNLNTGVIIALVALSLVLLFTKRVRTSPVWRATITPLASIIGSGFLVSAPLLILIAGKNAIVVMAVILIVAYALGSCIRFNIKHIEPVLVKSAVPRFAFHLEKISHPTLGLAYLISVAFYLKLLSAFALAEFDFVTPFHENLLTTLLLLFIGITGKLRGLRSLENLEMFSVHIKLSIIIALIIGHFMYNLELFSAGEWVVKAYPHQTGWTAFREMLGLLIIVQGFETSRYLGEAYSADIRVRSMRHAQFIASAIYFLFIALAMVVFNDIHQVTETSIIDISRVVAPLLPLLLIVAAIMSQFSAAVADTIASGGLLTETAKNKINLNTSYLLITAVVIAIVWLTNIYEIIVFASKAFAAYYAIQVLQSFHKLKTTGRLKHRWFYLSGHAVLFTLMLLVIFFGIPVEGIAN